MSFCRQNLYITYNNFDSPPSSGIVATGPFDAINPSLRDVYSVQVAISIHFFDIPRKFSAGDLSAAL